MVSVSEAVQSLKDWAAQGPEARVPTGYQNFDRMANGGVALGELAMFVARSGVGKTLFACNVAINNRDVPTIIFSLEMQARYIAMRLAAIYGRMPSRAIEAQLRSQAPSPALDTLVRDYPLIEIVDTPGISLRGMAERLDDYEARFEMRPKLVIIDYLELVRVVALERNAGIDQLSKALKNFARDTDTATWVLHQLNREGVDPWKPVDRKAIRWDADVAADYTLAAYRPGLNPNLPPGPMRESEMQRFMLQVLKTRTSAELNWLGTDLHIDPESMRITDITPDPVLAEQQAWAFSQPQGEPINERPSR